MVQAHKRVKFFLASLAAFLSDLRG
jgi:hypothetical protein